MTDKGEQLNFTGLVEAIRQVHEHCVSQAGKAINVSLTLRNWVIGYYILEYEQRGADRADYGERLLESLSDRLQHVGMSRVEPRELRRYRQFYLSYSRIWESLTPELRRLSSDIGLPVPEIRDSATPEFVLVGSTLITSLSFTHLNELIAIDDPLKRAFYEVECIRGSWSVRELKRQIGSLYFERSGLSKDKEKLAARIKAGAETFEPRLAVRDPYVFEFLGLRSREVMGESDLEDAVLDRLQEFLLELGHGFCFEARQKRILIGDAHGFVDLVFYHRILKCHVLVELKVAEFNHEHMGQLNTYVSWYKRNVMIAGDNPPVGILLCTRKDHALVEYALADMDNRLFVSKYQLELPSREEIQRFVETQFREHR
ncbi:MAG TPA: PDDEXK nuclease domain-containing protein [Steroidobacteraceae bacterium]|nr:PDDEXK nuclease domain-containing protein [Steroidobacteraceae bacterium]